MYDIGFNQIERAKRFYFLCDLLLRVIFIVPKEKQEIQIPFL